MLSHGKFTNKLMSPWMKWTYYELQGKTKKIEFQCEFNKKHLMI
jgi:hypothetical protein